MWTAHTRSPEKLYEEDAESSSMWTIQLSPVAPADEAIELFERLRAIGTAASFPMKRPQYHLLRTRWEVPIFLRVGNRREKATSGLWSG